LAACPCLDIGAFMGKSKLKEILKTLSKMPIAKESNSSMLSATQPSKQAFFAPSQLEFAYCGRAALPIDKIQFFCYVIICTVALQPMRLSTAHNGQEGNRHAEGHIDDLDHAGNGPLPGNSCWLEADPDQRITGRGVNNNH